MSTQRLEFDYHHHYNLGFFFEMLEFVMVLSRQYIVTLMGYFCVKLKSVKHIGNL